MVRTARESTDETGCVAASTNRDPLAMPLRRGIVLRVQEEACELLGEGQVHSVRYAAMFPSPRTERVSPGHLVAVATAPDGSEAVVWRWYDAVLLGEENGRVRLWEPSHGEVEAEPRSGQQRQPGTRAYLSAGSPVRTGGSLAPSHPRPRLPKSSSTRWSGSTPSTASGTASSEIGRRLARARKCNDVPEDEPSAALARH